MPHMGLYVKTQDNSSTLHEACNSADKTVQQYNTVYGPVTEGLKHHRCRTLCESVTCALKQDTYVMRYIMGPLVL